MTPAQNPWRYTGVAHVIDSESHITNYITSLQQEENCQSSDFGICTGYIALNMSASSCFSGTKLKLFLLSRSRREPFYRNTKIFEFDLELTSQCVVVINKR